MVLAHQSNGSLCEWLPTARRLAARGVWVFAFDFRGHGFSKGRIQYGRLAADYAAAVKAARALGARNVVLAGASLGGIAAVVAGANVKPPVDGVVSVSSPARFRGMDAAATAPRLRVPVLYLAAEADDNAGFDFSQDAEEMHTATASTDKALGSSRETCTGSALSRVRAGKGAHRDVSSGALRSSATSA